MGGMFGTKRAGRWRLEVVVVVDEPKINRDRTLILHSNSALNGINRPTIAFKPLSFFTTSPLTIVLWDPENTKIGE